MSRISSSSGWRDCTPTPSGPTEPAIKTSREADSRASRAIFTPRLLSRWTSSPSPRGASLKRLAPKVFVSMMCAPASMYAWCTRKTASGSVALSSSKQRCEPTDSYSIEPIAPSAMRIESLSLSLKSWIFTVAFSCLLKLRHGETRSAFLLHEAGDGAHEIVFGEDLEVRIAHVDKNRGVLVAQDVRDALDRRGPRNLRQGRAHHFTDDELAKILALQREIQNLVFIDRANGDVFFENGNLRDVLLLHGFQGVENSLIGARDDQLAHLSNGVFGVDDFRYGDGRRGIHVAALAHPFFVVNLAEVAHAGIRQQGDDEIVRSQVFRKTQGAGNASTAGAAREETFHFCEAARDDKTFFVIYLNDVVKDFQIHRCREKIFTDAFYDVRLGLDLFSRLEEIVVERTVGIDADDFDVGILFLQIFSHTTDRPAGTHAADKVRDFSFAVFPNFRARRLVVRFRIHWIVVLIGVVRIGNFTSELFCHGIITARIFRLDGRGANDDFGAERFQEIHFFLGLLVRGGENTFITAHGRNKRQPHAGIAGSSFDNRAAWFQQALLLGFVNHGDADAVLHGAAGIGKFRFDVNLRLQALIDAVQADQRRVADRFQNVVTFHAYVSGRATD